MRDSTQVPGTYPQVRATPTPAPLDLPPRTQTKNPRPTAWGSSLLEAIRDQSSKACTTSLSIVFFGPVNHFFADTFHQIARTSSVPIVRTGA
jgi:hypothetical protein